MRMYKWLSLCGLEWVMLLDVGDLFREHSVRHLRAFRLKPLRATTRVARDFLYLALWPVG